MCIGLHDIFSLFTKALNIYVKNNGDRRFEGKKTDWNSEVHRTVTKDFIPSIVAFRFPRLRCLNVEFSPRGSAVHKSPCRGSS